MTSRARAFWSSMVGLLFILGLAAALPYSNTAAQPARTPRGQDRGGAGGLAATVEAQSRALEATVNAAGNRADDLAATVEAGMDTALAEATRVVATAQYLATLVHQSPDSIQATVAALGSDLAGLSDELETQLTYFAELGSVSYENGVMTATMFVSEEQANLLLDVLVEAAGYDPDAVSLNTISDDTIEVTLVDVSAGFSGTLVMTYRVTAVNGAVSIELVSVAWNGQSVPVSMLPDELVSAVELAVNAAAVQPMLSVPEVGYSIETLHVTDEGILLSVAVVLE